MLEQNKNSSNGKPIKPSLSTLKKVACTIDIPLEKLINLLDCALSKNDISVIFKQFKNHLKQPGLTYQGKPVTPEKAQALINDIQIAFNINFPEK